MVSIRRERSDDYQAVYYVDWYAFEAECMSLFVKVLRKSSDYIPGLSLVAVENGEIVGHILFVKVEIENERQAVPALALLLLAVPFDKRNRGVGSKLLHEALRRCRGTGHRIVIADHFPDYYSHFGFSFEKAKDLEPPFSIASSSYMGLELVPGALKGVGGEVIYPPFFD